MKVYIFQYKRISIGFLAVLIIIIGLNGCTSIPLIKYRSTVGEQKIPAKAKLTIKVPEIPKKWGGEASRASIANAIRNDLVTNLFHTGYEYDINVEVSVNHLKFRDPPWGLLWLPLIYIGFPMQYVEGEAILTLSLYYRDGSLIETYKSSKSVSHWIGLYYGWRKHHLEYNKDGGVLKDALQLAMEDVKQSVVRDRYEIGHLSKVVYS